MNKSDFKIIIVTQLVCMGIISIFVIMASYHMVQKTKDVKEYIEEENKKFIQTIRNIQ